MLTSNNLHPEKKEKAALYRSMLRADLVDELYEKILRQFVVEKKYRDATYSAKKLAADLRTNTRYISAVINARFHQNYPNLVNEFRVKEAMYLLVDKRHLNKTMEDICSMVGFANRQSFYTAFYKIVGVTPRNYRINHLQRENTKE